MQKGKNAKSGIKGFTIVEMLVTILILIILGTISMITYTSVTKTARDSLRLADLGAIKTSVELTRTESGYLPIPDYGTGITYSGGLVWTQGTFGKDAKRAAKTINKVPVDPLTQNEYSYSIMPDNKQYELGGVLEGDIAMTTPFSLGGKGWDRGQIAQASQDSFKSYIIGTYNGKVAKTSTGLTDYVLAVPSIIATDISNHDLDYISLNKKLSYKGTASLPASYGNPNYSTGGFDFVPKKVLVWKGKLSDLKTGSGFSELSAGLYGAYLGTNLYLQGDEFKYINGKDVQEFILGAKLTEGNLYRSCKEIKEATKATQNGCYSTTGQFLASDITCLDTENKEKYYCDMQKNGGGRSLYVKIKGNYTFEDAKNCVLGTKINNSLLYCRVPFAFGKNKELWYQDLTTGSGYVNNIDEKFNEWRGPYGSLYKSTYFDLMYSGNINVVAFLRLGHNFQHINFVCDKGRFPGGMSSNPQYMNYQSSNIPTCGPYRHTPGKTEGREASPRAGEFYVR